MDSITLLVGSETSDHDTDADGWRGFGIFCC